MGFNDRDKWLQDSKSKYCIRFHGQAASLMRTVNTTQPPHYTNPRLLHQEINPAGDICMTSTQHHAACSQTTATSVWDLPCSLICLQSTHNRIKMHASFLLCIMRLQIRYKEAVWKSHLFMALFSPLLTANNSRTTKNWHEWLDFIVSGSLGFLVDYIVFIPKARWGPYILRD